MSTPQRTSKRIKVMQPIPYKTIEELNPSIPTGWTKQKQMGRKGQRQVTYQATYVDGKETSRKLVSKKVVKKPIDTIIEVGAKEESSSTVETAFDPDPTPIFVPAPAFTAAERAKSLQGSYPGIPTGWSIDNYLDTVARVDRIALEILGRELKPKEMLDFLEFCSTGQIPARTKKKLDFWFPPERAVR